MAQDTWFKNSAVLSEAGHKGFIGISPASAVTAHTTTESITAANFETNHTNTGAAGAIVLTLPAANTLVNKVLRVYVTVAQQVSLSPASTDAIYLAGSGVVNKDVVIAGVIGNYCDIYCDGTYFYVVSYSGVVTKEA